MHSRAIPLPALVRVGFLVASLLTLRGAAADAPTAEALRILRANCFSCHDTEKHKGGLILSSAEGLLSGGDSGAAVVPGKPDESPLIRALATDADPHMPPKRQLSDTQIDALRRWISGGAPWDEALLARLTGPRDVQFEPLPAGHHPVHAIALSPDGKRLAFGRGDRVVLRDLVATNAPFEVGLPPRREIIRSLAWSADGRRLAAGTFREFTVWDATTLAPLWTVSSNLVSRVSALRFTPHGGALIAADSAATEAGWIRIYDASTGRLLTSWQAHADTIFDLAISPDGGVLATAGGDKLIKSWELVSQREIARFEGHVGAVFGIAFNPGATEIVSVGGDRQLKLWDTRTREAVVTIAGRRHTLNSVAWSVDGSRVAAIDEDGALHSFTEFKRHTGEQSSATATERQLGRWEGPLHAVAISADGKTMFAGADDGVVRQVSADGKLLSTFAPPASEADTVVGPDAPSFVHDVLPMLAKAGCAAGACHAKADGQNGFKLSVFNYDPRSDFAEIVTEGRGRRVFPAAPTESLLLLKPTAAVEHGGGQRIDPGSEAEALLLRWIRAGMPYQRTNEPALARVEVEPRESTSPTSTNLQLRVLARYADGTTRDVTALADYISNDKEIVRVDDRGSIRTGTLSGEGVVVARFMGFVDAARVTIPASRSLPADRYEALPVENFIDELAWARFRKLGLFPSDLCTDTEFLRRASLDTIGVLPTEEEAQAFVEGAAEPGSATSRNRRAGLVDRLLARPEFGDYWANKWADLLRPNPDRVGVKSVFVLDQWLREKFRANTPYDRFVREMVVAEGSNHRDGPAVVYRDRREPPELATLFSQVFLGVRLECAKCHHHPNEKWSQDDFYQFAAVFGAVRQKGAGLSPPISAGTETFYFAPGGAVKHPVTGVTMQPRPPDGPPIETAASVDPRRAFADWLTAPGNPFLARAAVNRVWASFFGRGLVQPVDDFRVSNPASNEPLLGALADHFVAQGFDLKALMRTILNSRLYQLSSTPNEFNLADTRNFSRAYRRRLPAEVLLDAVNDITGARDEFNGCPPGTRAMQTWSYKIGSQFLDAFGRPNSSSDCPCERDLRSSVVQALHLMNSRRLQERLAAPDGSVRKLAAAASEPEAIVRRLYLATLTRLPNPDELRVATAAFSTDPAARLAAAEDVLWALLNSAEFAFNH